MSEINYIVFSTFIIFIKGIQIIKIDINDVKMDSKIKTHNMKMIREAAGSLVDRRLYRIYIYIEYIL